MNLIYVPKQLKEVHRQAYSAKALLASSTWLFALQAEGFLFAVGVEDLAAVPEVWRC